MKFDVNKFAASAALTSIPMYFVMLIVRRLLFFRVLEKSRGMFGHGRFDIFSGGGEIVRTCTPFKNFFLSFVVIFVCAYIGAWIFAWTYNRLLSE